MFDLVSRENSIFEILQKFADAELPFVVVGGYAVSAYRHRFSVDADVVIRKEDTNEFEKILRDNGFSISISRELDVPYASFIRYENAQKVNADLLVGGVSARQTGAFFSYGLLAEHSEEKEVVGTEKAVMLRIPRKELLIAMKLHSGRLTDFRDVAALSNDTDIPVVREFVFMGNTDIVKAHVKKLSEILEDRNFIDSFKGVFAEKKFVDVNGVRKLCKSLL